MIDLFIYQPSKPAQKQSSSDLLHNVLNLSNVNTAQWKRKTNWSRARFFIHLLKFCQWLWNLQVYWLFKQIPKAATDPCNLTSFTCAQLRELHLNCARSRIYSMLSFSSPSLRTTLNLVNCTEAQIHSNHYKNPSNARVWT